jgi:uncharacterized membrane protein
VSFSALVFLAAAWALSTEMIEDAVADLIYGHIFGWKTFVEAMAIATVLMATDGAALIIYGSAYLQLYMNFVRKGAAVLLAVVGAFWLVGVAAGDREEEWTGSSDLVSAVKFVAVEELEILLIIIPLVLASHVQEAVTAAAFGIVASAGSAFLLRKRFARLVRGRLRALKLFSGSLLIFMGAVLYLFG